MDIPFFFLDLGITFGITFEYILIHFNGLSVSLNNLKM